MTVFLSGVRTGFGSFGGSLRNLSATELGTVAAQSAIQRSGLAPGDIGHVIFGNVAQTSSDAAYLARHIGLKAGLLVETPAVTVNRLCGSGFEAIVQGAQLLMLGEADAALLGCAPGSAFLRTRRLTREADGRPIEYVTSLLNPAFFALHLEF